MLSEIFPKEFFELLAKNCDIKNLCEIRLRLAKPILIFYDKKFINLQNDNQNIICDKALLEGTIERCCQNSLYAFSETINKGYIPCKGGIRVGLVGEGVIKNNNIFSVKNISSLCIRVPHEIKGCCDSFKQIFNDFDNTIVLSKVGYGKTTILREIARNVSNRGSNILLIDDRFEISGSFDGHSQLDIGENTDIAVGVPKDKCYSNLVRTMRPEVVVTDEVFSDEEIFSILDMIRCGIKVVASLHCDSLQSLKENAIYKKLLLSMRYIIILEGVGKTEIVYDRKLKKCIV